MRDLPSSVTGTGFIVAPSVLVTCWHCVSSDLPAGQRYGVARKFPLGGMHGTYLEDISQDPSGIDMATARVSHSPSLGFSLADRPLAMGEDAWTFGYPMTDVLPLGSGGSFFISNPDYLKAMSCGVHVLASPSYRNSLI